MNRIMTAEEWCRRPTWHGSYDDYVKHIQYYDEQQRKREIEEIATRVAEKLKGK